MKKRHVFLLEIVEAQQYTWQGRLRWIQGHRECPFRSTLEMLHLISSAVEEDSGGGGPAAADPGSGLATGGIPGGRGCAAGEDPGGVGGCATGGIPGRRGCAAGEAAGGGGGPSEEEISDNKEAVWISHRAGTGRIRKNRDHNDSGKDGEEDEDQNENESVREISSDE